MYLSDEEKQELKDAERKSKRKAIIIKTIIEQLWGDRNEIERLLRVHRDEQNNAYEALTDADKDTLHHIYLPVRLGGSPAMVDTRTEPAKEYLQMREKDEFLTLLLEELDSRD